MTLAEVFLLLLFVVWWGTTIKSEPGGVDPKLKLANLKAEVDRLKAENAVLKKDNRRLKMDLSEREKTIEALRVMLNCIDGTIEDCKRGLEEIITAAKRGSPKCEVANVLVEVAVYNGKTTATIVGGSEETLAALRRESKAVLQRHKPLSGQGDISAFLSSVRKFYQLRSQRGSECRFDYRLSYSTSDDYHEGRQLFERYFYPAGIIRVQP